MLHLEPTLQGKTLPSIYLTITGGGTGIIPKLLEQGGASNYFVGAEVPYAIEQTSFISLLRLGHPMYRKEEDKQIKLCSARMAQLMAEHSIEKSTLTNFGTPRLGIGVTASLMKSTSERHERTNEAYACFNLSGKLYEYHWTFSKENYWENDDSLIGGWERKVTRKYQEEQLINLLYKTLIEILNKQKWNITNE